MTTVAEQLRESMRNQHNMIDQAVSDLTPEQFHWAPPGSTANTIAFTLWHYVRTEDNVVQFILQDRKPTIWIDGGYFERYGLDRISQGTGMTTDDAQALRLPAIDQWLEYQRAVWQATDAYLSSVDEDSLERPVIVKPLPEMKARQALNNIVLTHGHGHMGEMCVLRVLQGLRSSLI
jgi:hypothetical protein